MLNRATFYAELLASTQITIAALLALLAVQAHAFNINPLERPDMDHGLPIWLTDKISQPVHETMTMLAYDCHARPQECEGSPQNFDRLKDGKRLAYLVNGVEWNDDPSLKLIGDVSSATKWIIWMKDAERKAKCLGKYRQQGACPGVGIGDDLLYRSHYGDLQFLHAMASKRDETAKETKRKMMLWAEFVYKVGVGAIDTTATLVSLRGLPGINEIFVRPGFTVHYLLARETDRRANIKKVAIGSLLHVIQDSYSDAHTERIHGCNSLAHNKGEIVSFRLYGLQNPEEHKEADIRPTWLDNGDLSDNNPVSVSARIVQFWLNSADWDNQVRPFLDEKVWPLHDPQAIATAGDVECFSG